MAYTVFFKEANQIFTGDTFIDSQPIGHQKVLRGVADELAESGTTSHPQATKNLKGDWSILVNDNTDVFIYTLFISKLERENANIEVRGETQKKQLALVIIDPSGPKDSVGGYHPGYWPVHQYADFIEDNRKELFMQTVYQIEHNIPSEYYSVNNDGSISIRMTQTGNTSAISPTCQAKWV